MIAYGVPAAIAITKRRSAGSQTDTTIRSKWSASVASVALRYATRVPLRVFWGVSRAEVTPRVERRARRPTIDARTHDARGRRGRSRGAARAEAVTPQGGCGPFSAIATTPPNTVRRRATATALFVSKSTEDPRFRSLSLASSESRSRRVSRENDRTRAAFDSRSHPTNQPTSPSCLSRQTPHRMAAPRRRPPAAAPRATGCARRSRPRAPRGRARARRPRG